MLTINRLNGIIITCFWRANTMEIYIYRMVRRLQFLMQCTHAGLFTVQPKSHTSSCPIFCSITGNSETKRNLFFHSFPSSILFPFVTHTASLLNAPYSVGFLFLFRNASYSANKCSNSFLPVFHSRAHL